MHGKAPSEATSPQRAELERVLLPHVLRVEQYLQQRIPIKLRALVSAADLTQEVLAEAFRQDSRFVPRNPEATGQWLKNLARYKLLDAIKTRLTTRRSGSHRVITATRSRSSLSVLLRTASDRCATPVQDAATKDAIRRMGEALTELPENRRIAIHMRYIEERPIYSIAQSMDTTESAVRSILAQGIRQLRQLMGKPGNYFSDSGDNLPMGRR